MPREIIKAGDAIRIYEAPVPEGNFSAQASLDRSLWVDTTVRIRAGVSFDGGISWNELARASFDGRNVGGDILPIDPHYIRSNIPPGINRRIRFQLEYLLGSDLDTLVILRFLPLIFL